MRFFIYCLACVVGFSHISHASGKTLPPLPTLELPATTAPESQNIENVPATIPLGSIPENNNASRAEDGSSKTSTLTNPSAANEEANFIDTGNFLLPKINKTDPRASAPTVPSTIPDYPQDQIVVPRADVNNEEKQNTNNIAADNPLPPPPPNTTPAQESQTALPRAVTTEGEQSAVTNEGQATTLNNNLQTSETVADKAPKPAQTAPTALTPPPTPSTNPKQNRGPDQITQTTPPQETLHLLPTTPTEVTTRGRGNTGSMAHDAESNEDQDRLYFVNAESVMLLLEDDDVVLGKLTKKAYLDSLHGKDYINLFLKTYVSQMESKKAHMMDSFIRKYEFLHEGRDASVLSEQEAKKLAFEALKRDNIDDLRIFINNYPILQSYDRNGNNMLMLAIELDNVPISKFLLIKGADLFGQNSDGESILSISRESGDPVMQRIINDAMFIGKVK